MNDRKSGLMSVRPQSLSRRAFIAGAAGAAASLAVQGSTYAQVKDQKVKVGVIGCGGRGSWLARLFARHDGYEMHAVADYFQDAADATGDALGVDTTRRFSGLSGYRKVIDSGVDAVALVTPPFFFPEHSEAAVDAGLHVHMAKPVAVDVPGCMQVQAAAKKATDNNQCFMIDYQMPTDPHNIECARRFREGALGRLGIVTSLYSGGAFSDPPLTDTIESRLRGLVWVHDGALGGGLHVNACIHPVQAAMWVLDQVPVAAVGISRISRPDPHGDTHDMYGITFEFADGLVWSHTGRHTGIHDDPAQSFAMCEFMGSDAYMRIGYSDQALIDGGPMAYAGGTVENLYAAGAIRNITTFYRNITEGICTNDTVKWGIDSCLTTILGREACRRKGRLTMDKLLRENKRLKVDLTGLRV